jgi:hypothetical protein
MGGGGVAKRSMKRKRANKEGWLISSILLGEITPQKGPHFGGPLTSFNTKKPSNTNKWTIHIRWQILCIWGMQCNVVTSPLPPQSPSSFFPQCLNLSIWVAYYCFIMIGSQNQVFFFLQFCDDTYKKKKLPHFSIK